jgi:hypothetical protein
MVKIVLIGKNRSALCRHRRRGGGFVETRFILRQRRGLMVNRSFHSAAIAASSASEN